MKKSSFFVCLICMALGVSAQNLTITDLTNVLGKKNVETLDQYMSGKGWTYYNSERENSMEQNITWSYGKNRYSDEAKGWLVVYLYDGNPATIVYNFFNEKSYNTIKNSLSSNGFKTYNSEILDGGTSLYYKNASYYVQINTSKRDYSTQYVVRVLKKGCHYDSENGKKTEELDDGGYAEYTLKDGKISGQVKLYDEDGNLATEMTMQDGKKNGAYKEFYPNGRIKEEGTYKNDQEEGLFKYYYEDGKIQKKASYKNGVTVGTIQSFFPSGSIAQEEECKNGNIISIKEYVQSDDGRSLLQRQSIYDQSGYSTEIEYSLEKDGHFCNKTVSCYKMNQFMVPLYLASEEEMILRGGNWFTVASIKTEQDGIQRAMRMNLDNLLNMGMDENGYYNDFSFILSLNDCARSNVCYYTRTDDGYDGKFCCYIDTLLYKRVYGSSENKTGDDEYPSTSDTTQLQLHLIGNFKNNQKDGLWKEYYPTTGTLKMEERYSNGKANGLWKKYAEDGRLALELPFKDGKLDGQEKLYLLWDSTTMKWEDYYMVLTYKRGKRHGETYIEIPQEKRVIKGHYDNDERSGLWIDSTLQDVYIYHMRNDKKHGEYKQYQNGILVCEKQYENGLLQGKTKIFNKQGENTYDVYYKDDYVKAIKNNIVGKYEYIYCDVLSNKHISITLAKKDTITRVTYQNFGALGDYPCNEEGLSQVFENMWSPQKLQIDGVLKIMDGSDTLKIICIGVVADEVKVGEWDFYDYRQGVKMTVQYDNDRDTAEMYYDLSGNLFSGEYEYINRQMNVKEVRKIKDGVCKSSKTKYYDLKTDKKVKLENVECDYCPLAKYYKP